MSSYPKGVTYIIKANGCKCSSGQEWYSVSAAQASETKEMLESRKHPNCKARFTIQKV